MKFCTKCGKEIMDDAVICVNCGCAVDKTLNPNSESQSPKKVSVSLILGIVGIVFAWLIAIVGHITSIVGIIFGIKEYKSTSKMSGLVLSIIGEVCSIFSSIIGAVVATSIF